VSQKYFKR